MGEQNKNLLIGIFIIAACTLLVMIILFLRPKVGDGKKTLYVRFANINKISIGTRVTFAGRPVGEVVEISEIYEARAQPTDSTGSIYYYQLTLKIDSSVVVYNTDEISLQTSGLLGEKSVAIIPRPPKPGVTPEAIAKEPIYAESTDPLEHAFKEFADLADSAEELLQEITCWFKENKDCISQTIASFEGTLHHTQTLIESINNQHLVDHVNTATEYFSKAMKQIDDAIETLQKENVFTNIGDMVRNFTSASISMDMIAQDIADGTGTLGKLITGDDMYLRVTSLLGKADTLMNDINHYGMLFHLNKQWQRTRLQRVNLLEALSTPQDFKNYFETEVSQINSSMSRIGMLINRAEQSPKKEEILSSDQFLKDFAELLRQADDLADNLRLYNEQLMEAKGN